MFLELYCRNITTGHIREFNIDLKDVSNKFQTRVNKFTQNYQQGCVFSHSDNGICYICLEWGCIGFSHLLQANVLIKFQIVVFGGVIVIVLATRPKFPGFKPGRGRWISKGDKNPVARRSNAVGSMS
jgi:hypothetical protein